MVEFPFVDGVEIIQLYCALMTADGFATYRNSLRDEVIDQTLIPLYIGTNYLYPSVHLSIHLYPSIYTLLTLFPSILSTESLLPGFVRRTIVGILNTIGADRVAKQFSQLRDRPVAELWDMQKQKMAYQVAYLKVSISIYISSFREIWG